MLISIEGCIGVGKTALVQCLSSYLECNTIYEEFENNPFLIDFYHDPHYYALHVQVTFLFLQERQIKKAIELSSENKLVICDFHPLKSIIFSQMVLTSGDDKKIMWELYNRLFANLSPPDLLIYLYANVESILERIKKRDDIFTRNISPEYIEKILYSYNKFFNSYQDKVLTIDVSNLDYETKVDDLAHIKSMIENVLTISPYSKYKGFNL